jgi:hypothetical protein
MFSTLGGVKIGCVGYFHESFSSIYSIFIHTMGYSREEVS